MSGRRLRSSNTSSNGEERAECMANLLVQQFNHGDIVWSRIDGRSWWPVQVADEKFVACKPKKMTNDQILVRLYGTFEHLYVEPLNCVSKIEKIFGQENNSNKEVFQKFLEEDLTRLKTGGLSAATVSESKEIEKETDEASRGREQRKVKRTMTTDDSPLVGSSNNPKAAKQVKVLKGIDTVEASKFGITKRRTRSETFKARNEGTNGIEVSKETQNLNSGASTISSLEKNDSRSMRRHNDAKEKLTLNSLDEVSESKFVKQDTDVNNNALIEFSDANDIKKLVTKIVKEEAEKARNEALKGKGMERCPENTEHIDSSRKKSSEIKKMKRLIPRRVKNKDIEAHITGAINDTQGKAAGPNDIGKPNGPEELSNGASLGKIHDNNETEMPNMVERTNNETQGINGVDRSKGYSKEMVGDEKSQPYFAKQGGAAMKPGETKGDQRNKVVKQDVSREKMESPSTTKCFLSPRCARVMQSLGLIAPLGSPFCRTGLIRSFMP